MKYSYESSNNSLWFVISCKTIGGAERRMLNLATQVSNQYPSLNVNFLITPDLYNEYCRDTQLEPLLVNSKIQVHLAEWPETSESSQSVSTNSLMHKLRRKYLGLVEDLKHLFKHLFPNIVFVKDKIKLPVNQHEDFYRLINNSWYQELLRFTSPGDRVHCFVGRIERNGGILLSQHNRKVIIEVTSNRILSKVVPELQCLLTNIGTCPNLKINCVSETVYQNFLSKIGLAFLQKRQIVCTYYKTPCLPIETYSLENVTSPRENIIVFAHRFVGPKNGLLFAKLVSDMHQQGELTDWKVNFRGRGDQEEAIRNVVKPQIEAGVVDVGWSHDLEGELRQSKIFISIIETGSYPSQSLFQAMRNGNLLVLGDAGETVERFAHEDVYFTEIKESAIRQVLIAAMSDASNPTNFKAKSEAMIQFFQLFLERSNQTSELLSAHFALEACRRIPEK